MSNLTLCIDQLHTSRHLFRIFASQVWHFEVCIVWIFHVCMKYNRYMPTEEITKKTGLKWMSNCNRCTRATDKICIRDDLWWSWSSVILWIQLTEHVSLYYTIIKCIHFSDCFDQGLFTFVIVRLLIHAIKSLRLRIRLQIDSLFANSSLRIEHCNSQQWNEIKTQRYFSISFVLISALFVLCLHEFRKVLMHTFI